MRDFWLFRSSAAGLDPRRRTLFWIWNGAVLLLAGLCLGVLSLLLAFGTYAWALLKSYFEHPVIAALNLLPVVLLLLVFYGLLGRPWAAFLADAVLVGGFSLANYYLLRCRDDPLMFEDIKYLREAGAITQNANYDLSPDARIWLGLLCIAGGDAVSEAPGAGPAPRAGAAGLRRRRGAAGGGRRRRVRRRRALRHRHPELRLHQPLVRHPAVSSPRASSTPSSTASPRRAWSRRRTTTRRPRRRCWTPTSGGHPGGAEGGPHHDPAGGLRGLLPV